MTDFQQHINNMKASREAGQYFYHLDIPTTDKIELFNQILQEEHICRAANAIYFLTALAKLQHSTTKTAEQLCELLKKHENKIVHLIRHNKNLFEMIILVLIQLNKISQQSVSDLLNYKTSEFCFYQKIQNILLDSAQSFEHERFNAYITLFQNHPYFSIQHVEILHLYARFDQEAEQSRDEFWKNLIKSFKVGELSQLALRDVIYSLLEKSRLSFSSDLSWIVSVQQFALDCLTDRELNQFMTVSSLQSTKQANKKIDPFLYVKNTLLLINKQLNNIKSENQFNRILEHMKNLQIHILNSSNRLDLTENYMHLAEKLLIIRPSQANAKEKIQALFTLTHDEKTLMEIINHDKKNASSSKHILSLIQSHLLPLDELEKLKDWKDEITALITGSYNKQENNLLKKNERIELLTSLFNEPQSAIYQYMRIKRGWKTPSIETGCLKACSMKAQELGILPKVNPPTQSASCAYPSFEMTLFSKPLTENIVPTSAHGKPQGIRLI